jgi:thiamine biosynthesis lipoprotein
MQHTQHIMGTVVSFRVPEGEARAIAALDRAQAKLRWVDDVFSTYKPDSPVSRLRREEITLQEAPPAVAEVLELCRQVRAASDGWFDPWRLPGGVDPTGLVKGWAADLALDEFKEAGVTSAMINAGGDVVAYGEPGPGEPWGVGVRDPTAADRLLCTIEFTGAGAVATSGTYERGQHLLDPHTGVPSRGVLSATVIGPDLTFTDALATALFVSEGRALQRIGSLTGFHALLVDGEGALHATPRFPLNVRLAA